MISTTSHTLLSEAALKMKRALEHTLRELAEVHTGKATPAMVENVMVEGKLHGEDYTARLKDCAAITTPNPRMIQIQPWDAGMVKAIEKAIIQAANLGFHPVVDGKVVRVSLPFLTQERRQELARTAARITEDGRVRIRNARRDALEAMRKAKLPQDESKRLEKDIQSLTDTTLKDLGDHLASKEKGLLSG